MDKIYFSFICFCVLIGIALSGCETKKIEFKTESAFKNTINNIDNKSSNSIKKNKNIYIYTYGSEKKSNSTNVNFGPTDVDFDLPGKFR